jgi:hypothetical protein
VNGWGLRAAALTLSAAVIMSIGVGVEVSAGTPAAAAARSTGRVWSPVVAPHSPAPETFRTGVTPAHPCVATFALSDLCMVPFPNDYYSVPDPTTVTGRRIDIPADAFPAATGQGPFDPGPWEGNDGFSPGSTLLVSAPGVDLAASHVATISDMGASLRATSPVVLLDTDTGQRWPTWTELDARDRDPATQLLLIHPTQNLTEGDHYVVALRNLRTSSGALLGEPPPFAAALTSGSRASAYQLHQRADVALLRHDGVSLSGLYLAWDFTVASRQNLTQPALTMRNRAFALLGSRAPSFRVTKVVVDPPDNPSLAREITGTFSVPNFLSAPGGPDDSVLHLGAGGLPAPLPGAPYVASFNCEIPKAAGAGHPARIGVYGHGLFGSSVEVYASSVPQFSNAYDYAFCGTNWIGLASGDLTLAATVVTNVSKVPTLVDHLMQSLVNAQYLGRLLDDPRGFASSAAFRTGPSRSGRPLIDASSGLVYYGNSEGGIMGGAFTALSTDVHRSVLGVPGMNYDILLPRSADFAPFESALAHAYPSAAVQQVGFDLIEMLWDRGEADGYAEQMTGGLSGTPDHQVLLEEAFGDHQVANIATETEARTIGASLAEPALAVGRSNQAQPYWDLPRLTSATTGPGLYVWDSGVPPAPLSDTPPTAGVDPHDTTPRAEPQFWAQMASFFASGRVPAGCRASTRGAGGSAGAGSRPVPCTAPYPSGS